MIWKSKSTDSACTRGLIPRVLATVGKNHPINRALVATYPKKGETHIYYLDIYVLGDTVN